MERSDLHDYNAAVRSGRRSHDAGLPVGKDGGDPNGLQLCRYPEPFAGREMKLCKRQLAGKTT